MVTLESVSKYINKNNSRGFKVQILVLTFHEHTDKAIKLSTTESVTVFGSKIVFPIKVTHKRQTFYPYQPDFF